VRRHLPLLLALPLAGCFTSGSDFAADAEEFILTNEEVHTELGVTGFQSADCDSPPRSDVGVTFGCTGVDDQGRTWEFEGEIIEGDQYVLTVSRFP
jgi:hypothetical protein